MPRPSPAAAASPRAVTVLITRRVRPGAEAAFEQAMAGMIEAARRHPGHLGGHLVRPDDANGDLERGLYHIVFAFDDEAHLAAWQASEARARWLSDVASLTVSETAARRVPGLEFWFSTPGAAAKAPPPRWKVAVVTWLGIFPTVWLLLQFVAPLLARWPSVPRVALLTGVVVVLMTWLIAPRLTRLLAGWLHAPASVPTQTATSTETRGR